MLCQNCGDHEANVRYTQTINGVKKEMILCDQCAKELGIGNLNFSMPISFSNFLGDFLEEYNDTDLLPSFVKQAISDCNHCHMNYDEFIQSGKFDCPECYESFSDRIDPILKNLHGNNRHVGRIPKRLQDTIKKDTMTDKIKQVEEKLEKNQEKNEIKQLKEKLQKAIKEEKYEDAAKIRDQIKEFEKKENN